MWPRAESAVRTRKAKRVPALVLCTHSQLTAISSPRLDKPIKFMSSVFSQGEKGGGFGVFSFEVKRFSCHHLVLSPQESKLDHVPTEQHCSHHLAPLFPALIIHCRDVTNPLLGMFCVIFSSARLSRCCDCKMETVGLLKIERETSTRLRGKKKSFGRIFRGIKHLRGINRLQPALFQPLCCLWIINVNRDRSVYFECGTTGAEWQDE